MPMKKALSFHTMMDAAFSHDDEGTATISTAGVVNVKKAVDANFPGAVASHRLALSVYRILSKRGYCDPDGTNKSLLATSFCSDEACRDLEDELREKFGPNYNVGGLAGFPFGGTTSLGAAAHHAPPGGSVLFVYGPHVGVDWDGKVGKLNRRGHEGSGACCGPARGAMEYVRMVRKGERAEIPTSPPEDCVDAQEVWIERTLLKYGERLERSGYSDTELPSALYDCQDEIVDRIVGEACTEIGGDGKIALLGGVQVNTPEGTAEYFLPKKFVLMDNKGEVIEDMLVELRTMADVEPKVHAAGGKAKKTTTGAATATAADAIAEGAGEGKEQGEEGKSAKSDLVVEEDGTIRYQSL